jgi:uncharacterized protein (UPF0303 family)
MENLFNKSQELEAEIKSIIKSEKQLIFSSFSNDDALKLGLALYDEAVKRKVSVSIDIRKGNHILFHHAMEGCNENNDRWIDRKSRSVQFMHKSSYLIGRENTLRGVTLATSQYLDPAEYAEHGGSFPITLSGVGVIGAVTVSGLAQKDDHSLVVHVLENFISDSV